VALPIGNWITYRYVNARKRSYSALAKINKSENPLDQYGISRASSIIPHCEG